MHEFQIKLHPQQWEVFSSPARFRVCVAGRKWGKTRLAIYAMLTQGLTPGEGDIYYVAPAFDQGKRILWDDLRRIGKDLIVQSYENTATAKLYNGCKLFIAGATEPDAMRGVTMKYAILDEYADMKPFVWKEIIRPNLIPTRGGALFIGTPKGKNHFYELYTLAQTTKDWQTWQFKSRDNPFLPPEELDAIATDYHGSSDIMRRELEASFESYEGALFNEKWLKYGIEPAEGQWYIAVDLAGFEKSASGLSARGSKLDETAIVSVKVNEDGWFVGDIKHGRWDVRETAVQILLAARAAGSARLAIEAGALKNAVMPYLEEVMRTYNRYPAVDEVRHGGRNKTERIQWALQGRFERGRITLPTDAAWLPWFIEQYKDFPNPQAHDDGIDALAYIDQIAVPVFADDATDTPSAYEPLDLVAGY